MWKQEGGGGKVSVHLFAYFASFSSPFKPVWIFKNYKEINIQDS